MSQSNYQNAYQNILSCQTQTAPQGKTEPKMEHSDPDFPKYCGIVNPVPTSKFKKLLDEFSAMTK